MKVIGLDNKEYTLKLSNTKRQNASSLHNEAREILIELFPFDIIYEEVNIPGSRLYIDFFLNRPRIAFEIQGEQHYKFVPHYHEDRGAFLKAQKRDHDKVEWCKINGIQLIELKYDDRDRWRRKIQNRQSIT